MANFYEPIGNYDEHFDILTLETDDETTRKNKKKKQEKALERAWQTRNFEIDKFWNRTAFFWGFIAVVFLALMPR